MQKHILKNLLFRENLTFSQLFQDSFESSSQFTYHLNALIQEGIVEKNNQKYKLSIKGKELASHLSSETTEFTKQPVIIVALLLKKGSRILTSCSKKEPLKGLWGLSCFAKIKFGDNVLDCLRKNCLRHTGYALGEKVQFGGIFHLKTKKNENVVLHHQLLVFRSSDFEGALKKETNTRINQWVSLHELHQLSQYPDNEFIIKKSKTQKFFELERDIDSTTLKQLYSL